MGVSDPKLKGHEARPRPEELPVGQISFPAMDGQQASRGLGFAALGEGDRGAGEQHDGEHNG